MRSRRNPFSFTPLFLLVITATLMGFSAVMIFSASATLEDTGMHRAFGRYGRQIVFVVMGFCAAVATSTLPYSWLRIRSRDEHRWWFQPNLMLLLVTVALLAMVLVPGIGVERNASRRWLAIGPVRYGVIFQPSELAKLSLVLFVAGWYGRRRVEPGRFFKTLLVPAIVVALCAGLVGLEDFGTAALLLAVGGLLLLGAGSRLWHLVVLALPALGAMGYLLVSKPYRLARLTGFLDIWDDPGGKGYHAVQSLCSIAAGGWWGTGLGGGLQKYGYLPEARTDFIFAIICEELGVVGGLAIIGLFMAFVWQGRKAAVSAPDMFGRLLALGVTLTIGLQAAMNIAVVTVSIPTKGIALPLVSAGGSGILFLGTAIGLLASVGRAGTAWRDWLALRHELLKARPDAGPAPQEWVAANG
jgi:cell division protein FtsW